MAIEEEGKTWSGGVGGLPEDMWTRRAGSAKIEKAAGRPVLLDGEESDRPTTGEERRWIVDRSHRLPPVNGRRTTATGFELGTGLFLYCVRAWHARGFGGRRSRGRVGSDAHSAATVDWPVACVAAPPVTVGRCSGGSRASQHDGYEALDSA
ncbi:hypothetical protein AXG93_2508s1060 [Marchantia polymorpha subsp. ruderalis]|uniref:Uncharacterized protein n=1 Tax=Marchantia polymorpha subsp. ruderalis TaxID=1480154 RepID=A0A176WET7_MARPO|nr:hypothetical protein AXG93_2508s1060 [Marchantia polymorpha subsp. ruderalis]